MHCACCAPCLQGLLCLASSALSPAALTDVHPCDLSPCSPSPCRSLSTCPFCVATICFSYSLFHPYMGSCGQGWVGQRFACGKCSVNAYGHKIRCLEWWKEHSKKQLPWSMPLVPKQVPSFSFSKEGFENLLPKSLQVGMNNYCKCYG